jgi:hypothetical protein
MLGDGSGSNSPDDTLDLGCHILPSVYAMGAPWAKTAANQGLVRSKTDTQAIT